MSAWSLLPYNPHHFVIPAQAGIQLLSVKFTPSRWFKMTALELDSRLRGNDEEKG
jgi:hypothetical protein